MNQTFYAWNWDGGDYIQLNDSDVVDAIYTAWNHEMDVYEEDDGEKKLIFSGQLSNEDNTEMLAKYGVSVVNENKRRHLKRNDTGEVVYAPW